MGNVIKTFRKKSGLTQSELANLLGVSFSTLRRWEAYGGQPRVDELKKICKVLGCTEAELLSGAQNDGKVKITLVWDWDKMKEGNIDMEANNFDLILGSQGQIGVKGSGKLTSREAMENFFKEFREQLEIAYETQIRRGIVPQEA